MSVGIFGVPLATITNTSTGQSVGGTPVSEGGNTVASGGVARGLLDQLFGDDVDPTKNAVSLTKIGKGEAQAMQTINALRQAMKDGFIDADISEIAEFSNGTHFSSFVGSFHFPQIREAIEHYYASNIFRERDALFKSSTPADYVFDGGIKKGVTCTIKVGGPIGKQKSWIETAREREVHRGDDSLIFDKFSVQSINEPSEERYQIVQTFGADILYSFGRRPQMVILSGTILNGKARIISNGLEMSMDWKNALQRFYEDKARSTVNTKARGRTVKIFLQDTIYEGYLLNLITNTSSANQSVSQVTMTLIVKRRVFIQENDNNVPPFLNEDGLSYGSKRVPREFLSNPDGISNTYKDLEQNILKRIKDIDKRIDEIIDTINSIVKFEKGVASSRPFFKIFLEKFVELMSTASSQEIGSVVNDSWSPVFGLRIHPLMKSVLKAVYGDPFYKKELLSNTSTEGFLKSSFSKNVSTLQEKDNEIKSLRSFYSQNYGSYEAEVKIAWINDGEDISSIVNEGILCNGEETGKTYGQLMTTVKKTRFSVTRELDYSEEVSESESDTESFMSFREPMSFEECYSRLLMIAKDLFFNTGTVLQKDRDMPYFINRPNGISGCGKERLDLQRNVVEDLTLKIKVAKASYEVIQKKQTSFDKLKETVIDQSRILDGLCRSLISFQKAKNRWRQTLPQ